MLGWVASYDIRPVNGEGLFLFRHFKILSFTYLLRNPLTCSRRHTATSLRCGGIVNDDFITNLLRSLPTKQAVKVTWHKATLPTHRGGSIIFARWCQCALQSVTPQSESYRFRPLLSRSEYINHRTIPACSGPAPFPAKLSLHVSGPGPPSNTRLPGPTQVHIPNDISVGSAVFARLTVIRDRSTDHATPPAAIGCI